MRIGSLVIYPIKSCRGVEVNVAEVTRYGLRDDRRWMLTDPRGRFLSQRTAPALARIATAIVDDALLLAVDGDPARSLRLPRELRDGPRRSVEVWRSRVEAIAHAEGSSFVSQFLGRPAELVYLPDDVERAVEAPYAEPNDVVSFADAFPFLLASVASLRDLNTRLGAPVTMRRFRPNLVVEGARPFDEDAWVRLRIGELTFRAPKPCARCVVVDLDPETGARASDVLGVLATFRKRDGGVHFGVNLIADGVGTLCVGDEIEVTERSDGT